MGLFSSNIDGVLLWFTDVGFNVTWWVIWIPMYFVLVGGFLIFAWKSLWEFRLLFKNRGDENGDGVFKAFTCLGLCIYLILIFFL